MPCQLYELRKLRNNSKRKCGRFENITHGSNKALTKQATPGPNAIHIITVKSSCEGQEHKAWDLATIGHFHLLYTRSSTAWRNLAMDYNSLLTCLKLSRIFKSARVKFSILTINHRHRQTFFFYTVSLISRNEIRLIIPCKIKHNILVKEFIKTDHTVLPNVHYWIIIYRKWK